MEGALDSCRKAAAGIFPGFFWSGIQPAEKNVNRETKGILLCRIQKGATLRAVPLCAAPTIF
jgi:hypothetical protein